MSIIVFKTVKKSHAIIVKQPFMYYEKYTQGANKGKTKKKRQVQYSETLDSIFVDDQKKIEEKPRPTPIFIKNGSFTVDEEDKGLLEVMRIHPDNIANGGHVFKEVNVSEEELYEIKKYEATLEAKGLVMSAEKDSLISCAVFFLGQSYLRKTESKIKIDLIKKIDENSVLKLDDKNLIVKMTRFFQDKNNAEKLATTIALKEGIISLVGGKKMVWSDSQETIFNASQSGDAIIEFSVWLKNDEEGRQVLSALTDKIDSL